MQLNGRVRKRFGLGIGLVALLGLAACGGPPVDTGPGEEAGARGGEDSDLAPDFTLTDLDGNNVSLADSTGQVRLIDFWATWCAPCREEVPMFKELHETYGGQGFTLLAVSMDDGPGVVRDFVEDLEIPYTNLMGTDEVAEQFGGVFGLPMAFLVDGDGRIVEQYMGPKPKKVLEKKIRELLGLETA